MNIIRAYRRWLGLVDSTTSSSEDADAAAAAAAAASEEAYGAG